MNGKVLLLSQRRVANLVAYCLAYEFEDTIAALTDSVRIDVSDLPSVEFSRRVYKALRMTSGSPTVARQFAPMPKNAVNLGTDFELFFPVFSHAFELYSLATISNWRRHCHKAACFITEVWSNNLPEYLLEMLSTFDHVFVGNQHCVADVARITGRPCTYLPLAVDVLRFAPASPHQARPILVCNIGRRSSVTHQALLEEAERRRIFYYFDTVAASGADLKQRTFRVDEPRDHRFMLATLLKHSSYFIANRSHVNNPAFTGGLEEISARFYEGAAAGAVMIGEAPQSEEFKRQFDWLDAVVHMPFDSPDVVAILAKLEDDPDRLQTIRQNGVRGASLKHDWLHRIQVVFDALGIVPTERMKARAAQLSDVAYNAQS
jgi:hypothetical protein